MKPNVSCNPSRSSNPSFRPVCPQKVLLVHKLHCTYLFFGSLFCEIFAFRPSTTPCSLSLSPFLRSHISLVDYPHGPHCYGIRDLLHIVFVSFFPPHLYLCSLTLYHIQTAAPAIFFKYVNDRKESTYLRLLKFCI